MKCTLAGSKKWWRTRDITVTMLPWTSASWDCGPTWPNRNGARATGMANRPRRKRCTPTGGAFKENVASDSSGNAENGSNGTSHQFDTGGLDRLYVRGIENVHKKFLIQAAACNLALLMRSRYGAGKPRAAHDHVVDAVLAILAFIKALQDLFTPSSTNSGTPVAILLLVDEMPRVVPANRKSDGLDTGC